ncbi:hypothetical protein H9P43_001848 [Blastocladiella emersonii ATCC 22665]|nr:hypothetical protein H9P43_001848 [Blastocladiella emersonii ATCC 22665]
MLAHGTLSNADAASSVILPTCQWTDSRLFTPLTQDLKPFFTATRELTWSKDKIGHWLALQSDDAPEGPRRRMYALWLPASDWESALTSYEAEHGADRVQTCYSPRVVEGLDLRTACPVLTLASDGTTWRAVATVAVEYENTDYGLAAFNGDARLMQTAYACRETHTASVAMLAVLPPFARRGLAAACSISSRCA